MEFLFEINVEYFCVFVDFFVLTCILFFEQQCNLLGLFVYHDYSFGVVGYPHQYLNLCINTDQGSRSDNKPQLLFPIIKKYTLDLFNLSKYNSIMEEFYSLLKINSKSPKVFENASIRYEDNLVVYKFY